MPDGARPGSGLLPTAAEMARRSAARHVEIGRAEATMGCGQWARAAVAWVQHVAPQSMPVMPADPEGVQGHLILFARHEDYWRRFLLLCHRRGLSDRRELP